MLRASLAFEGHPLTLQQEVKTVDDYNCQHVHQAFLLRLKARFPMDCRSVIVTDAGYKLPCLKQIHKLGWLRVRGNQTLQLTDSKTFIMCVTAQQKSQNNASVPGQN